jgi:carbon starvation protein
MAALSLLIVTVWLASARRNPAFAGIPMVFMYVTTIAASLVTAWNLFKTIATAEGVATISLVGSWAMILVALVLVVAALVIAYDGWRAWSRYQAGEVRAEAAPTTL